MIYKLFTGQWIDISQVLTIEGPKDTTNGCGDRIGVFYVNFKFRDSPITYSKRLKYEPDWDQFVNDFNKFVGDWIHSSLGPKMEQLFKNQ